MIPDISGVSGFSGLERIFGSFCITMQDLYYHDALPVLAP